MKKFFLMAMAVAGIMTANAQEALRTNSFADNWSIGVNGGIATPMSHHGFFSSMRSAIGVDIEKQITPVFGLGAEGVWGINTSSWSNNKSTTAFDNSYVGAYGKVNLFNLLGGYQCYQRPFDMDVVAGAGWGHDYVNSANGQDWNYFATKVGLDFNYNVNDALTLSLKPAIMWDMSDAPVAQTSSAYDKNKATFNCLVGVSYTIGGKNFECIRPYDQAEVDALNNRINQLRGERDAALEAVAASEAQSAILADQLLACQNQPQPVQVVKEVTNNLESVRYVYFRIGSAQITPDQLPNVEMIAIYLKNHPESKVVIKGYASADGNLDLNLRLAADRAESVKQSLVNKYGIKASRITAEGEGIGHMFVEESWNRVAICTIEQ